MMVLLTAYLYAGFPPVDGVDSEIRALRMLFWAKSGFCLF